jgi:hypothetical protein
MTADVRALWYRSWLETHRPFRLGIIMMIAMGFALFMQYPGVPGKEFPNGALAVGVAQVRALPHDVRSYIWLRWFGNTLILWWPVMALFVAGTGVSTPTYLLSLPVRRRTVMGIRILTGLLELAAATLISTLFVWVLSLFRAEEHYSLLEALAHATLMMAGGLGLYGFFVLLATLLGERDKLIAGIGFLFLYGMLTFLVEGFRRYSLLRVMTGDSYFLRGQVPWAGLAISLAIAAAMIAMSVRLIERRDF